MISTIDDGLRMLQVLKERKNEDMQRRNNNNIVLVERRQINTNYPAVAQLNIILPNEQNDFKNYLNNKILKFPVDKDFVSIIEITSRQFIIELQSTKIMYSWFENLIFSLKNNFKEFNFEVKGCWDKY